MSATDAMPPRLRWLSSLKSSPFKLAFHDADTDTDFLADIVARIVARMSVSVSVSASWNSSFNEHINKKTERALRFLLLFQNFVKQTLTRSKIIQ